MKKSHESHERAPLCARLETPVSVAPDDLHIIHNRITSEEAAQVAEEKIRGGVFRPEDIDHAEVEAPHTVYVPFWRLEIAVDGMHVATPISVSTKRGASIPIPLPGYRHRESTVLVCARRLFPFPPNHVERKRGVLLGNSVTHGGWHGIEIVPHDMRPFDATATLDAEVVEPDITRAQAAHEAGKRAQWDAQPGSAIFASYETEVRSAACCYFPLHVVKYRYEGHAAKRPKVTYWVTISGVDGRIVGGHHPSAVRSVARKIRKWMTFGG